MTPEAGLRKFIIKRFISTLLVVGVVEFAVITVVNWLLLPRVVDMLMPQIEGIQLNNIGNVLLLLLVLAGLLLSNALKFFLPSVSDVILQFIAGRLTAMGADRFNTENNALQNLAEKINFGNVALLLLLIILIIVLLVAPYVLGVTWFSTSVVKRFKELERQREEAQKEEERKRYLMISDIVHDLKTPMTTVSGYAQALSDGMVAEESKQEYLDAITAKTGRMNEIVTMLFDYVKLDSQGYSITKTRTDLCELVRECVADHYTDIENAGCEPDIDIPEYPIMIDADRMQFGRVINNLIANAIKHNPDGTDIGIFIRRDGDEIRVLVADSGNPIDKETADNLFDAFVTGDRSRGSSGGTGLGLFISRKICDMHGFTIKLVQSKEDMARYDIGNKYRKVFVITIEPE
ncbi:MAG: HAMP domain-containing histidine kinase [Clostridiales bacterium]|nr:HAMP domain-containing histidine kinase [Clostridiales bacterium]